MTFERQVLGLAIRALLRVRDEWSAPGSDAMLGAIRNGLQLAAQGLVKPRAKPLSTDLSKEDLRRFAPLMAGEIQISAAALDRLELNEAAAWDELRRLGEELGREE